MLKSRLGAGVLVAVLTISVAFIVFIIHVREHEFAVARASAAAQVAAASTGSDLFINGDRVVRVTFDAPAISQVGDSQFVTLSAKPLSKKPLAGTVRSSFDDLGSGILVAELKAPGYTITPVQDGPQPTASKQISWSWEISPLDIGQRLESHQFVTAEISFSPTVPQLGTHARLVYLDVVATQVTLPWYSQIAIIVPLLTGTASVLGLFVGTMWHWRAKPASAE